MDDDTIKDSLKDFEDVWKRVTGTGAPPPAEIYSEDTMLQKLIHSETCAAQQAAALARMLQGDGRAILLRHAADAKRHGRRLRAEYFIRTGVSPAPMDNCPGLSGKLASLRASLLQAGGLTERYEYAAAHSDSEELRQVYQAFASDTKRRAQETRALLIDSF